MTESQERRAAGVQRVAVARVVDICGRDFSVPAFEARSVEVSGRGMHVTTPYLPPLGAPLVCRLEENGREIIVEGVVSWAKDVEGGGQFGIRFTALDSGSVETLKELCRIETPEVTAAPAAAPEEAPAPTVASGSAAPAGTAVKLHIDGLGAPMKARVKDAGTRKLQVGSNLEFLKVGRGLTVENLDEGESRGAKIDAVSIAIDPQTQVPQLVVVLRYEGADTTPEPSVVGAEEAAMAAEPVDEVSAANQPASLDGDDDLEDEFFDGPRDDLHRRVDALLGSASQVARRTGVKASQLSGKASVHFVKWMRKGGAKLQELAANRGKTPKRRTTSVPPTLTSQRRLRRQHGEGEAETAAPDPKQRRRILAAAAGGLVLVSALGIAMASRSGKSDSTARNASEVPASAVAAAPSAQTLPPLGAPASLAPVASPAAPDLAAAGGQRPGIVANVPLFGPTPMATLEPAPLEPPPAAAPAALAVPSGAGAIALIPPTNEERMEGEEPTAKDESFPDGKGDAEKEAGPKPEDVKPWGEGLLHLPIVHKLKLDEPGAALKGTKQASGFTVVIPKRKVLDSGTPITKRDDRISNVRIKNAPDGAHVSFVFRSKVPTFKVRLRKGYVEFFVSSPGK